MSAETMMAVRETPWASDLRQRDIGRREARKHRVAERLALGDSRADAERFADAVDAWLRRLDAEDEASPAPQLDGVR